MTYQGFYSLPFNPQPSTEAGNLLLGNWEDAYNAFLQPYQKLFGNSSFTDFLTGQGRNYFGGLFEQEKSNQLASGVLPENVTSALGFLKNLDPYGRFQGMAPRDRGENPGAFSPFTRYLGRF